ncbi:hypothetical protein vseg_009071 [Gypsophila vaccaria]
MVDQEEEELQMALKMSMEQSPPSSFPPEPKRIKPRDVAGVAPPSTAEVAAEETAEMRSRRMQRELLAAAAERRLSMKKPPPQQQQQQQQAVVAAGDGGGRREEVTAEVAKEVFVMVFGESVSKEILAQWTNQGIRFSSDPETSMGLVQHEGGPCGVLAAIQGFVLKYLLFSAEESSSIASKTPQGSWHRELMTLQKFTSLPELTRRRALIRSMAEILFRCGNNKKVVIATLNVPENNEGGGNEDPKDEIILQALERFSIESASDLQKTLRVSTHTSPASAIQMLEAMLPFFESRMGAMLFLISALLSRGLESVQADRDDPSLPLVTAPFGHASQEIVNLLLSGEAVANVFDEKIDLGGGMFLKGVSTNVEVGFLTLLESLNFCKVGQHLKTPKYPIWVVGSESHYTVLFAFDPSVQEENEMEERESKIRRAFDAQDQSGGGGFISIDGLTQVLKETNINLPSDKLDNLRNAGFVVWSEFWQVLLDLDKNLGGFKDSSGLMGRKVFELCHFNGIAKSVPNGNQGETPVQRPRLTKLRVSVPPRWTAEEYMAEVAANSSSSGKDGAKEVAPEPPQHAPLVDCIRTRWPRATCNWTGDAPSIV